MKRIATIIILICLSYVIVEATISDSNVQNLGSYWLNFFKGSREYTQNVLSKFDIPMVWFIFHIYLFYLTYAYPINDLNAIGVQTILRVKSRKKWFLGKVIWIAYTVIIYYLLLLCILAVYLYLNNISLGLSVYGIKIKWHILFLLPLFSDIIIAIIQMTVSLFVGPVIAYIITIMYLVLSAYKRHLYLLGNCSMFLRYEFLSIDGIRIKDATFTNIVLGICAVFIGLFYFERKDIMGINEEV